MSKLSLLKFSKSYFLIWDLSIYGFWGLKNGKILLRRFDDVFWRRHQNDVIIDILEVLLRIN